MTATLTADVVHDGRWLSTVGPEMPSPEDVDTALTHLARPITPGDGFLARLGLVLRGVRSTPAGASMVTIWVFSVITVIGTLWIQPTRDVTTSFGPARVSCGLDAFLYGNPDRSVQTACRKAEALSLGLFLPAAAIALLGVLAVTAITLTLRQTLAGTVPSLLDRLREARISILPLAVGAVALVVGGFALHPVTITFAAGPDLVSVSCGPDTLLSRYPDAAIGSRCSSAYGGHAAVLLSCALVLLIVAANLARQILTSSNVYASTKTRAVSAVAALVLGVAGLAALAPIAVVLSSDGGSSTSIRCGLDAFLGGYPQPDIARACRSSYAGHAVLGLLGVAAALSVLTGGRVVASRHELGPAGSLDAEGMSE